MGHTETYMTGPRGWSERMYAWNFYDVSKPLYLGMDANGIGLGTCLLQMWECINCRCEEVLNNVVFHPMHLPASLSNAERWYSNIERKAVGYATWAWKVPPLLLCKRCIVITDHKLLVALISEEVATLSCCGYTSTACTFCTDLVPSYK